ncbi:uncharacterized protein LOC120838557 [Ixodes scapularis]|uniref:uncharacterized protein LOC120838557 n=1 Tax=Ixodes scapularis TaxID=6945 RepID=UPI001C394479|nr:uncharacterized protein LOC120838557 [Ixodes scapularis]
MEHGVSTSNGVGNDVNAPTPKTSTSAEPYCDKYYCLLKRYNSIQRQNYHLMYRIQRVKKLTARLNKEKRFLIQRLNNYKQEKHTAMPQYPVDERQYRRVKQEPVEPMPHYPASEYSSRKRKEKCPKAS